MLSHQVKNKTENQLKKLVWFIIYCGFVNFMGKKKESEGL